MNLCVGEFQPLVNEVAVGCGVFVATLKRRDLRERNSELNQKP